MKDRVHSKNIDEENRMKVIKTLGINQREICNHKQYIYIYIYRLYFELIIEYK